MPIVSRRGLAKSWKGGSGKVNLILHDLSLSFKPPLPGSIGILAYFQQTCIIQYK